MFLNSTTFETLLVTLKEFNKKINKQNKLHVSLCDRTSGDKTLL